jgi:DNA-binding GntR family transcriptional regulator
MQRPIKQYSTKKAWVVEQLRNAILTGALQPGQRLLETELAEQFRVSPTPVREAMRELETEGLVSSEPHRGVRVAEANVDEMREFYLIRIVMEELAMGLAMDHVGEIPVDELQAMIEVMADLLEQERWAELRALHRQFHDVLYKAAHAPNVQDILNRIWVRLPWDRIQTIPGRAPLVLLEHREIVAAVAAQDKARATRAVRNHLENAMNAFLAFTREAR